MGLQNTCQRFFQENANAPFIFKLADSNAVVRSNTLFANTSLTICTVKGSRTPRLGRNTLAFQLRGPPARTNSWLAPWEQNGLEREQQPDNPALVTQGYAMGSRGGADREA